MESLNLQEAETVVWRIFLSRQSDAPNHVLLKSGCYSHFKALGCVRMENDAFETYIVKERVLLQLGCVSNTICLVLRYA